jgi:hypothetical protein
VPWSSAWNCRSRRPKTRRKYCIQLIVITSRGLQSGASSSKTGAWNHRELIEFLILGFSLHVPNVWLLIGFIKNYKSDPHDVNADYFNVGTLLKRVLSTKFSDASSDKPELKSFNPLYCAFGPCLILVICRRGIKSCSGGYKLLSTQNLCGFVFWELFFGSTLIVSHCTQIQNLPELFYCSRPEASLGFQPYRLRCTWLPRIQQRPEFDCCNAWWQ